MFFAHVCVHTNPTFLIAAFGWKSIYLIYSDMAFFEQAAVLATAWANEESLKALGAKCSLIQVTSKKMTRSLLHAYSSSATYTAHAYIYIYHAYILSCQGHLGRNATAVGLAVDKLGMRPAQDVVEQAVYQFFSLCLPKFKEVDSA